MNWKPTGLSVLACPVLACLAFATPAWAADSAYTSLKTDDCRTVELDEETGSSVQECRGRDGYRVLVASGDDRSWLRVQPPRAAAPVDLYEPTMAQAPGQFANVAQAALEWRYGDRRDRAVALIHRLTGTLDDGKRTVSTLLVIRLAGDRVCVLGRAATNEQARALADGPAACP